MIKYASIVAFQLKFVVNDGDEVVLAKPLAPMKGIITGFPKNIFYKFNIEQVQLCKRRLMWFDKCVPIDFRLNGENSWYQDKGEADTSGSNAVLEMLIPHSFKDGSKYRVRIINKHLRPRALTSQTFRLVKGNL
jgi:hypothetical protein